MNENKKQRIRKIKKPILRFLSEKKRIQNIILQYFDFQARVHLLIF